MKHIEFSLAVLVASLALGTAEAQLLSPASYTINPGAKAR